jgi:hypothetical protein
MLLELRMSANFLCEARWQITVEPSDTDGERPAVTSFDLHPLRLQERIHGPARYVLSFPQGGEETPCWNTLYRRKRSFPLLEVAERRLDDLEHALRVRIELRLFEPRSLTDASPRKSQFTFSKRRQNKRRAAGGDSSHADLFKDLSDGPHTFLG